MKELVESMIKMSKAAASYAERLKDASTRTGASASQLSNLKPLAEERR